MPSATRVFHPDAASVAAARQFSTETAERWGLDDVVWTLTQVVSELATNAVIHARTDYTVTLHAISSSLRLTVEDRSRRVLRPRAYARTSTTGRGLRLVESLAADWGVDRAGIGKCVWAELAMTPSASSPADMDIDELMASFEDQFDDVPSQRRDGAPPEPEGDPGMMPELCTR